MSFNETERRLIMRYDQGRLFSFNQIRIGASNQGVFDLATAFASVQSEQPTSISVVVTSSLF